MKTERLSYCLCDDLGGVLSQDLTFEEAIEKGDKKVAYWLGQEHVDTETQTRLAVELEVWLWDEQRKDWRWGGVRMTVAERKLLDNSNDPWRLEPHDYSDVRMGRIDGTPHIFTWMWGEAEPTDRARTTAEWRKAIDSVRNEMGVVVNGKPHMYNVGFRQSCMAAAWLQREVKIYVATGGVACSGCGSVETLYDRLDHPTAVPMKKHVEPPYVTDKGGHQPEQVWYQCWPCGA